MLLSDAECNEGSIWEAAMFAAHHRLSNLVAIIDVNRQQAFGYTRDVLDLIRSRSGGARSAGTCTRSTGTTSTGSPPRLDGLDTRGPPHVLVAATAFGKGVSYMESEIKWHYLPMSDRQFEIALRELEEATS